MAVTQEQCDATFARIEKEKVNLFDVKTAVELGVLGGDRARDDV